MPITEAAAVSLGEAAEHAERAYRRGFQQGHHAAMSGAAVVDLHQWRFHSPLDKAIDPHSGVAGPTIETSLDRLTIESLGSIRTR